MKRMLLVLSTAALLASTTFASAQVWDNPPGYAFQRRGIIDSSGLNPNRYYRGYGGAYSAYGYAAAPRYYGYGRDDPPGSAFQDRGNDEDLGRDTLRWR